LGEKKDLVRCYMAKGLKRDRVLELCGISKNQFYHQPSGKKRGRKVSQQTNVQTVDGIKQVPNGAVIDWIKKHLINPLNDEGYHRMTGALQLAGYYINHKKVYRLMKSHRLLHAKVERKSKNYVQYRILCPAGPLRLMEIDIKYVWIDGERGYAYILTIIDVFTRVILYWEIDWHIKQKEVQQGWQKVIEEHLEPAKMYGWELHIEVRSDNGPQFSAKKLRAFLEKNYLIQTFTHPYTPQENGHIESFHAILGRDLNGKYFVDLNAARLNLVKFYDHYNNNRIHGSTLNLPPMLFWKQWDKGNIERIVLNEKKRQVKFKLKTTRQLILLDGPAGIRSSEGGLLPNLEGSTPDEFEPK
jgi:putative transposase